MLNAKRVGRLLLSRFRRQPAAESPQIMFGPHSYAHTLPRVVRYAGDPQHPVSIGAYTSIAANVEFVVGGNHRPDWVSTYPVRAIFDMHAGGIRRRSPASRGAITVGSDVWIGRDSLILSGVTIGHGAVIGARSVVTRSVDPYTIAAGSPAKPIRRRFDDETIAELLDIAWWDWPHEEIGDCVSLLNGGRVADFLGYARSRRA